MNSLEWTQGLSTKKLMRMLEVLEAAPETDRWGRPTLRWSKHRTQIKVELQRRVEAHLDFVDTLDRFGGKEP